MAPVADEIKSQEIERNTKFNVRPKLCHIWLNSRFTAWRRSSAPKACELSQIWHNFGRTLNLVFLSISFPNLYFVRHRRHFFFNEKSTIVLEFFRLHRPQAHHKCRILPWSERVTWRGFYWPIAVTWEMRFIACPDDLLWSDVGNTPPRFQNIPTCLRRGIRGHEVWAQLGQSRYPQQERRMPCACHEGRTGRLFARTGFLEISLSYRDPDRTDRWLHQIIDWPDVSLLPHAVKNENGLS